MSFRLFIVLSGVFLTQFCVQISSAQPLEGRRHHFKERKFRIHQSKIAESCEPFFISPEFTRFFSLHGQLKKLPASLWVNFRTERSPVILTNIENAANCAVVIKDGKVLARLTLKSPIEIENGVFNFYVEKIYEDLPADLRGFLKLSAIRASTVFNLSAMGSEKDVRTQDPKIPPLQYFDTFIHEDFHVQGVVLANAKLPTNMIWPKWGNAPDRDKITSLCYYNGPAKALIFKERDLTVGMMIDMFVSRNPKAALEKARSIVAVRKERYAALRGVLVPSSFEPQGISCEKAEAIMELIEGMAEYVGVETVYDLKLYSIETVLSYIKYEDSPSYWYYPGTSAQMMVINRLKGRQMAAVTHRLAYSRSWDKGVFYEFQKAIGLTPLE